MTAAYRLRGLGWFLSGVIVALGFYLVSLQVAAERKKLVDVNRRIATAQRDLRALETEFNTRANLAQLERWNGEVLALTAPSAEQFLPDEASLAQIDFNNDPAAAPVRAETAGYIIPAYGAPAATPVATSAPVPTPAPADVPLPTAAKPAATPATPSTRAAAPRIVLASVAPVPTHAGAAPRPSVRPQTVALLDRKLLSDSIVGDLVSRAHAEAGTR
ncbi:MAG: hypothetical protein B7Y45_05180 [Sphingomonas sp. 28-66-16]|nr:MAG: hypothetical protein B7Y45_05180 [Sphingomonas sp. 28-66-16]